MKKIALVFVGGGVGSICRHLIGLAMPPFATNSFPLGTFTANILGCFIIGLLVGKINLSNNLNLLLVTGFCGGFTTFSTFSKESLFLIENHQTGLVFSYVIASIAIGMALTLFGYFITSKKST